MSDQRHQSQQNTVLDERVAALASEVAALRESIVTAAEWDAESRRVRQVALDTTLADVRRWLRIMVIVVGVLILLVIALIIRMG
jgi:hypothetical protein